jgi:DNA polymerase sigma
MSSYSTVLLLVAYMNQFNLKNQPFMSASKLLMGFLEYYGKEFNPIC